MVYSAVDQVDYDQASDASSSASRDPSPAPGRASPPRLGHFIHSLTSTDYEIVEDDDYTAADPTPERGPRHIPPLDTTVARHSSSDPPLRSASSDIPIPLSHPTPDLQSLQGAYLGNVERLEQSAEQLSSSSVDIESEIRRMDQEQKRRSCSSASNSMILRNGTFSPVAASLSSPHGSILSAPRQRSASGSYLAHVSESIHDEDGDLAHPIPLPVIPPPQTSAYASNDLLYQNHYDAAVAAIERPSTAASNDTYQESRTLFTDFDGVHFSPLDRTNSLARRISLTRPPLASKPESYKEPQTGEHMVYYPAPVPRMLNLPPKLSRKPVTDREKRRTQLVRSVPAENRKSTAWLPGSDQQLNADHQNKRRQSTPLPQLRASVFLEQQQPTSSLAVEVKQDSAVATLESILDASARAPVSAFTDHPIAGHIGSYVYAKARGKETKNKWNTMGQRQSTNNGSEHEDSADERHPNDDLNEMPEGSDEQEHSEGGELTPDQEEEEEEFFDYIGPPNTLLAELELRKHEMQQRRRTALPTHGMQVTLLELDAMAQKQHAKRRRRPVTLAWDSRDTADDDEVPLAMLYPDKTEAEIEEEERPAGLMEKRQLEENEPLSTRRARLRGEPIPQPDNLAKAVHESDIPEREADIGEEGETLAERLRRLRGQNPADSEFANELLAEFDTRLGVAPKDDAEPEMDKEANHHDNDNETLAQRRSRLQKESGGAQPGNIKPNKAPRAHRSMAALPQTRSSHVPVARKSSHDLLQHTTTNPYANPHMSMPMFMPMQQFSPHAMAMGYPMPPMGYPMMMPPQGQGMMYPNAYPYNQLMMGMNGMYANGCGPNMARPPIDPTQRDVIDRWRQSIR